MAEINEKFKLFVYNLQKIYTNHNHDYHHCHEKDEQTSRLKDELCPYLVTDENVRSCRHLFPQKIF